MPTFVYDHASGRLVDKATREPMNPPGAPWVPVTPGVVPDIAPYRSPVTGEYISGRRAKRADLDRHNCVDAADLPSKTGGRFRNLDLARKWGVANPKEADPR